MPAPNEVVHSDPEILASTFASMLGALIATNRVADARALLAAAPEDLRASSDLPAWANVLAAPVVRTDATLSDSGSVDLDWIRRNAKDYAGQWVAVRGGNLLGSSDSLRELLTIVDSAGGRKGVLVHKL